MTSPSSSYDERFIEAFENVAGIRSDIRHMDADVSTLKTDVSTLKSDVSDLKTDVSVLKADVSTLKSDVSEIKTDVSELKTGMSGLRVDMAEFKGEIRSDMAGMEGRLHAHVNRQVWMTMSVMATLMVASVGLTGYFVRILA